MERSSFYEEDKQSQLIDEYEDELTCTICLDLLYQPVSTQCGHTFCKKCISDSLNYKNQCTICREPIHYSSQYLPINITLQKLIEKKYPLQIQKKQQTQVEIIKQKEEDQIRLDNIPIWIDGTHLLPGTNAILNIQGRAGLDLTHIILRGNRRFVIMKSENDMKGFVLLLKRVTPTMNRNEVLAEVSGVDRFIADQIFIPEDRIGLYLEGQQQLKFARGRVIKDRIESKFQNSLEESLLRGTFGEYPRQLQGTIIERAERQTLFVMSNLEFQNNHRELIFSNDPIERLNACIQEIQKTQLHRRLFVWEPEVKEKISESQQSFLLILALIALLFWARLYQ
ncbi:zinc finger (c3hc4-type ring finger) family protein [Stylonychia lemnae]|uniref:Zinc finger (C3hc4-type ring finger) family protein n=1 Tax=Stylonychia lemnae TaxID=5949 RepID=A0A078AHP2_STYLE|nr:zinc finger (c3hc4-type ring finger) family protein [Stylonychia lemnae]|eukprot:CDW81774.1 zinc finger (c3hc4-type ring finger) family protein [Stylonychia lemnae]